MSRPVRLSCLALQLSLALLALLSSPIHAASSPWSPIGPEGGSVLALAVSPVDHVLYAGTQAGTLYRSTDAGASWAPVGARRSGGFLDLLAHPTDARTLFALVDNGGGRRVFLKSTNAGTTWNSQDLSQDFLKIAPSSPDTLYAARPGLYRSTDGGGHWTSLAPPWSVSALAIDPSAPGTLYAGADQGVYKSVDGGLTWVPKSSPRLSYSRVQTLAIDPQHPATVYAGTNSGIWRSTDGGTSWTWLVDGIPASISYDFYALVLDPSSPSTVYASIYRVGLENHEELWRSSDGGDHWTRLLEAPASGAFHGLLVDPAAPSRLWSASAALGVLASPDGGSTWATSNRGIFEATVGALAASPLEDDTLLATTSTGLVRSTDQGAHWSAVPRVPLPNVIVFHPQRLGVLYAGTGSGLYRSRDTGRTWQRFPGTGATLLTVQTLVIDPRDPASFYALGTLRRSPSQSPVPAAVRSQDGGATWSEMKLPDGDFRTLVLASAGPSRLFVCGPREVYRSTDQGETWTRLDLGFPPAAGIQLGSTLLVDPDRPDTLYIAAGALRLLRSDDGGDHWRSVDGIGAPQGVGITGLLKLPRGGPLLASTSAGVFQSSDGGKNWYAFALSGRRVDNLVSDPSQFFRVYAASVDGLFAHQELPACAGLFATTCLNGRFLAQAGWRRTDGNNGNGSPMLLGDSTAAFWFFDQQNIELVLKVLDGRTLNGHFWVYYAALSDVEYTLWVTDTETGESRRFYNPEGQLASRADVSAFPAPPGPPAVDTPTPPSVPTCGLTADVRALCLQKARFQVTVDWRAPAAGYANLGPALPRPITNDSGAFWFFDPDAFDLVVKVLDERKANGHFWVFFGGLSDVEYTLTITDRATGARKTYTHPAGELASVADLEAF